MTERVQWYHANKKHSTGCIYNAGVCCDTPYPAACAGCGWNPEVAGKRYKRLATNTGGPISEVAGKLALHD